VDAEEEIVSGMLRGMRPIVDAFRGGDHLHVSDVIHKCLRQLALVKRLDARPPGRRLRDSEVITFRQGDAIHDFVRQRFVENHPESAFGRWSCPCKKTITAPMLHSQITGRHTCPHCGIVPYRYEEVPIPDEEYGIVGNPDFLMYLAKYAAYHVTEIKSINGDDFKELVRPIPDHIIQVLFYWKLMHKAGRPLTDKVSILYVNKAWSFKNPYREFLVDVPGNIHRLDKYIEDALIYKQSIADESAPLPYRPCPKIDAPSAKDCAVRVSCFQ